MQGFDLSVAPSTLTPVAVETNERGGHVLCAPHVAGNRIPRSLL